MTGRFAGLELLATAVLVLDERFRVQYGNPAAENLLAIANRSPATAYSMPGPFCVKPDQVLGCSRFGSKTGRSPVGAGLS